MGYTKVAVKSVGWVGLVRIFVRLITIGKTALLARILTPEQFGIIGVALLVLSFLEILTETGVNVFLVQEEERAREHLNAAWIISIIRGLIIGVCILLFAPVIVAFFNMPSALPLLIAISAVPVIKGFLNPSLVVFQKELQFRNEFFFKTFLFFIDAFVVVAVAMFTRSAISVVIGLLVSAILELVLSFVLLKPKPRLELDTVGMKRIIHSGKWVTIAGIFNYLFHNVDNIVVGKIQGAYALGIYDVGYKVASLPITEISDVVSRVTFPIYVKIGGDQTRLKKAFLKTMIIITVSTISLGLILLLFTEALVSVLLGTQWLSAVPVIKILIFYGVIRAISGSSSALFLALKKQSYITSVTLVSMIGVLVTVVPLTIGYGIAGAAISTIIGSLLAVPIILFYLYKVFR